MTSVTAPRLVTTPSAEMTALAGPSLGSSEVSTWKVTMSAGQASPDHVIDRDQVWMPTIGGFSFTVAGEVLTVSAGEALVVPGGAARSFTPASSTAEALVAMVPGGRARLSGGDAWAAIPWAE